MPVEPGVKSTKTRELSLCGVRANAGSPKIADPSCYASFVKATKGVTATIMEVRRAYIYFEDECPRIGSGWRVVDVREGDKWAHLSTETGRKARITLDTLDRLETATERMRG